MSNVMITYILFVDGKAAAACHNKTKLEDIKAVSGGEIKEVKFFPSKNKSV